MNEEPNNKKPGDQEKKLPLPLDRQLRDLLPEKELNRFREQLPEEFLSDASEGLDQVQDGNQLDHILKKLNQQLHQQLTHKKRKPGRRSITDFGWSYWAVIIIIILCICAFLVIRLLLHH
jgi:hypothetical protein